MINVQARAVPLRILIRLAVKWLTAGLLTSCKEPSSIPAFNHEVLAPRHVHGEDLALAEPLFSPVTLAATAEFIVIADPGAERPIRFVRKAGDGDAMVFSVGRQGDGPGEFRFVSRIRVDRRNGGSVWVYDPIARRLTHIPIGTGGTRVQQAVSGSAPLWDSIVVLRAPTGVRDPAWLGDSGIVAVGLGLDMGRLAYFNSRGWLTSSTGEFPSGDGVPRVVRAQVYQGPLIVTREGSEIVIATRFSGSLSSYTSGGRLLGNHDGPFAFAPIFHVIGASKTSGRGPTAAATIDQRLGYLDLAVYNSRILGLFSGRRLGDYPKNSHYGMYVHVFDLELKFVCALELDRELIAIAADEEGKALYGLELEPLPCLVRFGLEDDVCGATMARP